jgi:multiple sugar transport system ATP-binding protein
VRGRAASQIAERVAAAARTLEISELLDRKPAQLSGGQRQRVALGRAIVREPRAFLLDEPLSNLDPALRLHTRSELARLHRRLGVTTLYVTHDQEEAMTLGNRVAVLRAGEVEQVAAPVELYRAPATRFVAAFIGSPGMNLIPCRVLRSAASVELTGPGVRLRLAPGQAPALEGAYDEVVLGIRPHDVGPAASAEAHFEGVVELVEPRGSDVVVRLREVRGEGGASDTAAGSRDPGASRAPGARPDTFAMVLPADAPVREGDRVPVRLPLERLHFFDARTGKRLSR